MRHFTSVLRPEYKARGEAYRIITCGIRTLFINTRVISVFENIHGTAWHCARQLHYTTGECIREVALRTVPRDRRGRLAIVNCIFAIVKGDRRWQPAGPRCIHRSPYRIYREIDTRAFPPTRSVNTYLRLATATDVTARGALALCVCAPRLYGIRRLRHLPTDAGIQQASASNGR